MQIQKSVQDPSLLKKIKILSNKDLQSVSRKILNNFTTVRIEYENSYCTLRKYLRIFKNVFLFLKILLDSFQLYLIYDIKTVEKKLKELTRVKKHLEIFENILSEYNT